MFLVGVIWSCGGGVGGRRGIRKEIFGVVSVFI